MKRERFSKRVLANRLSERIQHIQNKRKFDENNGTAQLTEIDEAVDYGEKRAMMWLFEEFELWEHVE